MVFMPFTVLFFSLKKSESLLHEKFKLMGYY
jgi:hypothetical protein